MKISQERLCTWPRFKTEACDISEMAYLDRGRPKLKKKKGKKKTAGLDSDAELH